LPRSAECCNDRTALLSARLDHHARKRSASTAALRTLWMHGAAVPDTLGSPALRIALRVSGSPSRESRYAMSPQSTGSAVHARRERLRKSAGIERRVATGARYVGAQAQRSPRGPFPAGEKYLSRAGSHLRGTKECLLPPRLRLQSRQSKPTSPPTRAGLDQRTLIAAKLVKHAAPTRPFALFPDSTAIAGSRRR